MSKSFLPLASNPKSFLLCLNLLQVILHRQQREYSYLCSLQIELLGYINIPSNLAAYLSMGLRRRFTDILKVREIYEFNRKIAVSTAIRPVDIMRNYVYLRLIVMS